MRSLLVGFDSFDPGIYEALAEKGQMPNLTSLAGKSGYSRLKVCAPPQTEVSWTSIATGADPGTHGIFDFVHRDPSTYIPYVSILPTKVSAVGEQFIPPYTAKTFFSEAAEMGYPAIALWWPALFPARLDLPISTIPGLGTPDVRGQLGVGTYATSDPSDTKDKTRVTVLQEKSKGRFVGALDGPMTKTRDGGVQPAKLEFLLDIIDNTRATLRIGTLELSLQFGKWSPIFEIKFKLGMFFNVTAITQVILTQTQGKVSLYFLPLQIHPLHSTWHYGAPRAFLKETWNNAGPFLTLGWPQDTTALEESCITDDQFLDLCNAIFESRKKIYYYHLTHMKEGVLAGIFDCLDRVQHMFLRDREDIVHDWYRKLDVFVGETRSKMTSLGMDKSRFLVASDHGFKLFKYKFHLNRWLADNEYLKFTDDEKSSLANVRWGESSAYALGLNSIYLNVKGREGQGILTPEQIEPLLAEIKSKLLDLRGPDGKNVVSSVLLKHEAFSGPYLRLGPDLVVGYSPNYRASAETGLGKAPAISLEVNNDHWGADHCIDPEAVPGVLFANNRDVANIPELSFRDMPFLMINKHLDQSHLKPPSEQTRQGQGNIEERLKGLGYL